MTDDTARLRARIAELESRHLTVHRPTIERIKRAHTAMPLSAWASDETAQHRTYCQGQDEQCYLCALIIEVEAAQARIAALEGALRDCVDAMHEDNPASGWKEIIDNGRAALSGSPSADPRDAVIADLRDDLARILTDCASAPTPDFSNADCRHRCAVIARAALSRLTKDKAHG